MMKHDVLQDLGLGGGILNRSGSFMEYVAAMDEDLFSYADGHPRVYIYGAGRTGLLVKRYMEKRHREVDGFVVSDARKEKGTMLESLSIIGIDDLSCNDGDGIIVAVSPKFREEVVELLKKKGFRDTYLPCVAMSAHMSQDVYILREHDAARILRRHPVKKISRANIREWKNILLVSTNNIGDVLMQVPFLRNLRTNCATGTSIAMICQGIVAPFLERSGYVDRIVICDSGIRWGSSLEELEEGVQSFMRERIGDQAFDAVISLGWCRTYPHQFFLAVCSNATVKIAFSEHLFPERELYNKYYDEFFSLVISSPKVMHEVAAGLYMLEKLGGTIASDELEFWTSDEEETFAANALEGYQGQPSRRFVAVVPHANALDRMWDLQNYRRLLQRMLSDYPELVFVILGGKAASELSMPLLESLPHAHILDLTGKTAIGEAAAAIRRCSLYIGCNTGLLHIAAAWKVPTIEITPHPQDGNPAEYPSPDRYRAWGNESYVVRPKTALPGCGGSCYKMEAHCINQIRVEDVMMAVNEAMGD